MNARLAGSLRALARSARVLSRWRPTRAVAMAAVRGFDRDTFRRLLELPAVADVFLRGSVVRGPFYPLASDLDLVLLLRGDAARRTDDVRAVVSKLRAARWTNPCLRDWWQHLISEDELPLVAAYWELFGADEWRDRGGRPVPFGGGLADRRRLLVAQWVQQLSWSASAVQKAVHPGDAVHDFRTGLRKAAFFATRLRAIDELREADELTPARLFELRQRHAAAFDAGYRGPGRGADDRCAALAAMVRELSSSARRVRAALPADRLPAAARAPRDHWPAGLEPLAAVAACAGARLGDRTLHVLVDDAPGADDAAALVAALRRCEVSASRLILLVPAAAWPLCPLPLETSRPSSATRAGGPAVDLPSSPPLARDLLLFDTLRLASGARLAVGAPDAAPRLRRHLHALARATVLYRDGIPCTTLDELAAACRDGASPRSALAGAFERLPEDADDTATVAGLHTRFGALADELAKTLLGGRREVVDTAGVAADG